MSLTQDLANLAEQMSHKLPQEAQAAMAQAQTALHQSGIEAQVLTVGDALPEVTLPNALGQTVTLQTLLQEGPLVLTFYRGGWCPYCNMALRGLQQALPQMQALGANLVAIAPETPDHSLSTQEKQALTFEVLSDVGNRVARQFGLVFTLPAYLRPVYESIGIDLPAYNGDQSFELPLPATYVINPAGRIVHAFVNVDYKRREDPETILTVLKQQVVAA